MRQYSPPGLLAFHQGGKDLFLEAPTDFALYTVDRNMAPWPLLAVRDARETGTWLFRLCDGRRAGDRRFGKGWGRADLQCQLASLSPACDCHPFRSSPNVTSSVKPTSTGSWSSLPLSPSPHCAWGGTSCDRNPFLPTSLFLKTTRGERANVSPT